MGEKQPQPYVMFIKRTYLQVVTAKPTPTYTFLAHFRCRGCFQTARFWDWPTRVSSSMSMHWLMSSSSSPNWSDKGNVSWSGNQCCQYEFWEKIYDLHWPPSGVSSSGCCPAAQSSNQYILCLAENTQLTLFLVCCFFCGKTSWSLSVCLH